MNLLVPLPKDILVCCSGGVDSIAAAHWLSKRHNVTIYHCHHRTKLADSMEAGVRRFAADFKLDIVVRQVEPGLKTESEFRKARIKFLEDGNFNAITAHHNQDAVEKFLLNLCVGSIRNIPMPVISQIGGSRVFHPFLLNDKKIFLKYCQKFHLSSYITDDSTNYDPSYCRRNWIRNELLPQFAAKQIGLSKIVRKQYLCWKKSVLNSSNTGEPPSPKTN